MSRLNDPRDIYTQLAAVQQEVNELRASLRTERARTQQERQRGDALEQAARHFATVGVWPRKRRDD